MMDEKLLTRGEIEAIISARSTELGQRFAQLIRDDPEFTTALSEFAGHVAAAIVRATLDLLFEEPS